VIAMIRRLLSFLILSNIETFIGILSASSSLIIEKINFAGKALLLHRAFYFGF